MSYRNNKISKFNYYSNVKNTYESHLVELLKEPFYRKFRDMCDKLKEKNKGAKILKAFQEELAGVKKWDYETTKAASKLCTNFCDFG